MPAFKKVVIDTDFGTDADDAIAIALAMASDEIEVQAFTVVGRQSIYRKQMLEEFLGFLGNDYAVPPVYAGWDAAPPLPYGFSLTAPGSSPPASFPGAAYGNYLQRLGGGYQFNWFGDEGTLDPNSPSHAAQDATPAGYSTFEAGQQLVTLLSNGDADFIGIGPLTNLYQAITSPSLIPGKILIPQMTVMGVHLQPTLYPSGPTGTFLSAGIDYNLASDIVSALYVLTEVEKSNLTPPVTSTIAAAKWVTADVTLQTWLNPSQLAQLAASKHPFMQQLVKMIEAWTPIQSKLFGHTEANNAAFLHDPLTLACSFDEGWCDFQPKNLELVLTNGLGLRWIEREQSAPGTMSLNCALSVNEQEGQTFQDWLVQRLLKRFS
jgi:inosine-uridine nucleoside N-ribohydrolase